MFYIKLNLSIISPTFFGPSITIIVHSFELGGINVIPDSGFSLLGFGDYFGIILPEFKSTSKLLILP